MKPPKKWHRSIAIGLLAAAWLCAGCTQPVEFVDDRLDLLSTPERERITRLCRKLLEDADIHIMTVVLDGPSLDINAEAAAVFENARVGESTGSARGLLFLVDPAGSQVRLEVGYDLEGVFTDAFIGYIERDQMTPFFQAGRIGHGIEATVELLVDKVMQEDSFSKATDGRTLPVALQHLSGGAGARTEVQIGSGPAAKQASPEAAAFAAQPTPQQTLQRYMQVLGLHVKDPDLGIYTEDTREFFRKWLVTDAQQDSERKTLERMADAAETVISEDLAVVRFPVSDRHASPYFFRCGRQGWMLDFAAMSRIIGFNHKNQWFFRTTDHPFMFGFSELDFDRHGFPHPRQG